MRGSIVLDSNLLVLWVVGKASLDYIPIHKNTRIYSKKDFRLLKSILSESADVMTTPNVMTEASNLARQFGDPARARITNVLGDIAPCLQEIYVESSRAAKRAEFNRLGLTDCAILDALEPSHRLLTTDLDL